MKVRTTARMAAALMAALALSVTAAPFAGAQEGPYGSTTTTAPVGEVAASCSLSVSKGKPGDTVTATVDGVFFGETVRILFDNVVVAQQTAPLVAQASGTGVVFGGTAIAAQDDDISTTLTLRFQVPKGAAIGSHTVRAVGDTFTCLCNPDGLFTVVGTPKSKLARTGVELALLLVLALVLVIAGRVILSGSQRRRRAAQRSADERELVRTGR